VLRREVEIHGAAMLADGGAISRAIVRAVELEPLNVADFERAAADRLDAGTWGYFAGGAGDELTLRENVAAFARWQLRPRVLVDVGETTTATSVLGTPVSMPLLVAPTAYHRMAHPDGEQATARAAAAAGTIMCCSTFATATLAEVAAAAPGAPRWFQVYVFKDRGVTRALIDQAVEHGYGAIAVTIDAPVLGRRERDLRTGFHVPPEITVPSVATVAGSWKGATPVEVLEWIDPTLSWRDIEAVASDSRLPVLVKGVQGEEDAQLAVDHGAAGIVVSNHGGRQLDGVAATLDILPEVVEIVDGRVEVLMDGGVRRGTDVAKALALGARAVLVGRAVLWGLAVGGEEGARRVLELLQAEIANALALLGCPTPADVTRGHVRPAAHLRDR
jgi:isopentenyl diphosphate isomerase/L-lactate dehydrogenase-like FMN-dependent dehydrogenase